MIHGSKAKHMNTQIGNRLRKEKIKAKEQKQEESSFPRRFKSNCPHVGPGATGEMPSVGDLSEGS